MTPKRKQMFEVASSSYSPSWLRCTLLDEVSRGARSISQPQGRPVCPRGVQLGRGLSRRLQHVSHLQEDSGLYQLRYAASE